MNIKLSKEEFMEAVSNGVKEAILEMTESTDIFRTEQFMYSIEKGVYSSIWGIATNASDMPCTDFYDSIRKGVKEGIENLDLPSIGFVELHNQ